MPTFITLPDVEEEHLSTRGKKMPISVSPLVARGQRSERTPAVGKLVGSCVAKDVFFANLIGVNKVSELITLGLISIQVAWKP